MNYYTEEQLQSFQSNWHFALREIEKIQREMNKVRGDEYSELYSRQFEILDVLIKNRANYPEDGEWQDYLGFLLQWQRVDGYACYMIVLDDRGYYRYHPVSEYSVEDALLRGLDLGDVRRQVQQARSLARMFS